MNGEEPEIENDDELLLTDKVEEGEQADQQQPPADEDDDVEILFGDEVAEPAETDNDLVRHLRKVARDQAKQIAELSKPAQAVEKIVVGEYPEIEDFDFDTDRHKEAVRAWVERDRQANAQKSEAEKAQAQQAEAWQGTLRAYEGKKTALARPDYKEAEDVFAAGLDIVRQAMIIDGAEDPAKVVYALGKSPHKLAELAKITSPSKFVFAVAKLEAKLVVAPKRKPPEPEQIARGSASVAVTAADKREAELEKQADKSGDRSALIAYRRDKREMKK